MSDYIKREDAIFVALQQPLYSVVSQIKQLDGTDIIRCGECKWYGNEQKKIYECCTYWAQNGGVLVLMNADDFCSRGERREL